METIDELQDRIKQLREDKQKAEADLVESKEHLKNVQAEREELKLKLNQVDADLQKDKESSAAWRALEIKQSNLLEEKNILNAREDKLLEIQHALIISRTQIHQCKTILARFYPLTRALLFCFGFLVLKIFLKPTLQSTQRDELPKVAGLVSVTF